MPVVRLRGPLKQMASGQGDHEVEGRDVSQVLLALEAAQPGVAGWILDERKLIRRHINVFVNGEPAAAGTAVDDRDRVDVLPAISGGSAATCARP
jgi:molybdopterin converting factor small subunit